MGEPSTRLASDSDEAHVQRTKLVGLAFALLVLHNIDEGFIHPEDGGKLNVAGDLVLGVLVVIAYARLRRRWRVALTGVLGVLATLQALGGHVAQILNGAAKPLDYSGLLYLAGGLLLFSIAVADFRHRGDPQTSDT